MHMLFLWNNFSLLKAKVENLALIKSRGFFPQSSGTTEINPMIPEGVFLLFIFYYEHQIASYLWSFHYCLSTVLLIRKNRHKVLSQLPELEIKLIESILF